MLQDSLPKTGDSTEVIEAHMRKATPVKSVTAAKRLGNCKLSIDGSKDERLLTNYTFMKNKTVKHDIIKMDDIA